jgi:hypothetical protein
MRKLIALEIIILIAGLCCNAQAALNGTVNPTINGTVLAIFNGTISSTPESFDAEYYVTQAGAGSGDGSSLANAMSVATFNGTSGDYSNDCFYFFDDITTRVVPAVYGTSGGQVTLDGYEEGDCNPLNEECTSSADLQDGMEIGDDSLGSTVSYITVQDFRMTRAGTAASVCFYVAGTSGSETDHIIVRRNYVRETNGTMIKYQYVNYSSTYDNKAENFGQNEIDAVQGVDFVRMDYFYVGNNDFGHNESTHPSGCTSANVVEGHGMDYGLLEYNNIQGAPNQAGISFKECCDGNNHIVFRFNKSHDNAGNGLGFGGDATSENTYGYFYGNNIYNNGLGGENSKRGAEFDFNSGYIWFWSNIVSHNTYGGVGAYSNLDSDHSLRYLYFYNNTIVYNGLDNTSLDRGGVVMKTGTNLNFLNNIYYMNNPNDSGGRHYNFYEAISGVPSVMDYNTSYHTAGSDVWYLNSAELTLAQVISTYTLESNSHYRDPVFTDPDGVDNTLGTYDDDYTLDSGSIESGAQTSTVDSLTVDVGNSDAWMIAQLSGKYSVSAGVVSMTLTEGLLPSTDWSGQPDSSKILIGTINARGAYVYQ